MHTFPNAARQQVSGPILSRVSGMHEYDYVDGPAICKPWPGIDNFFPGPYFAYHFGHDVDAYRSAIDVLQEVIDEDGPYDGVIAFSQGAALAVSLLVTQFLAATGAPRAQPPFKVAVFICSTLPLCPEVGMGKDRRAELEQYEASSDATYSLQRPLQQGTVRRPGPGAVQAPILAFEPASFKYPPISIPTFHIVGAKDTWSHASYQAYELCDRTTAKLFVHRGGHEVPKHLSEVETCAQSINSLFAKWRRA